MKAQTNKPVETKNKLTGSSTTKKPLSGSHNSNGHKQKTNMNANFQTDDDLKDSEIRYRRLFESAKDGILLLDAVTGQITDANPFITNLLGYSYIEMLGKKLWEIGLFKDSDESQAAFQELRQKKYIRYDELPLQTKQGANIEVEFVSNVYLVNGEKVIQCNIRDITERKMASDHLQKVNKELSDLVIELQNRDREMKMINQMNDLLQSCKTLEEAYQVIGISGKDLFKGQNGGLAILHDSGQFLETTSFWGNQQLLESVFTLEDCWAMRRGQIHEVSDVHTNMICQHFTNPPTVGYLCYPMVVQGETMGLFYQDTPAGLPADQAQNWKQKTMAVAEGIKISLSNLRLRELMRQQANHDTLTGLFNRRYLDDTLPRELNHARRKNSPISIAMLDIDHFKKFNDTFGHEAGDVILREIGHLFRENLRSSDIACRYGGEEFVLVLLDSTQEESYSRFEKIREQVKDLQIRYQEKLLGKISVSIGIVEANGNLLSAEELVAAADKALYAAKHAGRDCMINYSELEPDIKKNLDE
jgi:diguanylate cyclase (GGDEF)-like protein/PAS domain S-box-containing protein